MGWPNYDTFNPLRGRPRIRTGMHQGLSLVGLPFPSDALGTDGTSSWDGLSKALQSNQRSRQSRKMEESNPYP